MNTKTLHFTGEIRTLEPLTVSIKDVGMPKSQGLAYLPSSTINGAIRQSCLKYLIAEAKKNGNEQLHTLETYYSNAQGYVLDNEKTDILNKSLGSAMVDDGDDIRTANPALSLFGRWKLGGKFGIGNAYTSHESQCRTIEQGFRSAMFERNTELLDELPKEEVNRYYKLLESQSSNAETNANLKKEKTAILKQARKEKDEAKKALLYEQANALDEQIKNNKSGTDEGKETILRPIDNIEAIDANVSLSHRMTLKQVTDEEIGLALFSWAQFSLNPQFGGKSRHNYGTVHGRWDVTMSNEDTFEREHVGTVKFDDDGFSVEGDLLLNSMKAFKSGTFDYTRIV